MVPTTSIAGRHAADRRRAAAAREAQQDAEGHQQHARTALNQALRSFGLRTHPHLDPALAEERSIWVDCRLERANADHDLVHAILDQQGWAPDRRRLSRVSSRYDIARIHHKASGAALTMIIKLPVGAAEHWEAA